MSPKRIFLLLITSLLTGCFGPSPEDIKEQAESKVLSLMRNADYELLSDRDKESGTEKEFEALGTFKQVKVKGGQDSKYYELEKLIVDHINPVIVSSIHDPVAGITTVEVKWQTPEILSSLIFSFGPNGIKDSKLAQRLLDRLERGVITEGNLKLKMAKDSLTFNVDPTGVFIGLEQLLRLQEAFEFNNMLKDKPAIELFAIKEQIAETIENLKNTHDRALQLNLNRALLGNPERVLASLHRKNEKAILFHQVRDAVSFTDVKFSDINAGGAILDIQMQSEEMLAVKMLFCDVQFYGDDRLLLSKRIPCGRDLHSQLKDDPSWIIKDEAAARKTTEIKVQVVDYIVGGPAGA